MKLLNIFLAFITMLVFSTTIMSQCPFNNAFYIAMNPAAPGATVTEGCVWGGDLITVNVTAGQTYIFSLCGNIGADDSQITLYNTAGTVSLGYSDDFCGLYSEITWVATFTGTLNVLIDEYNCIDATSCMTFDVTWVNSVPLNCTDNDECATATPIVLTASGSPGTAVCVTDCNTGATPGLDFAGNVCADMLGPTVWYTFTTDAGAATLDIDLTSASFLTPEFAIFLGCGTPTWTIIDCIEGAGGTASGTIQIAANTTYVIAVSDVGGGTGNFNLCINQNIDNSLCNVNDILVETSSSDAATPVGGPYSPGEAVNFCYNILQFRKENCNWLQGIVPTFGDCWDPASFNAAGMPIVSTPPAIAGIHTGSWGWYPAGAVQYNNIVGSLPPNAPLPGGWYFQCNDCGVSNPDPDLSWGDGGNLLAECDINGNGYTWSTCFTLIAGPLSNCTTGTTNCGISIKTYADGEIGGWTNTGCVADLPYTAPAAFACCAALVLDSTRTVSCNGTSTGAIYTGFIGDSSTVYTYLWTTGATTQDLVNIPAGTYTVTLTDPVNFCTDVLTVIIANPTLVTASIASSTNVLCNGASTGSATAAGAGGTGAYSFVWSNGRTTAANTGLAAGTYCVTVSDANACTASACVTITQPSAVTATITSSTNVLCNGAATGSATANGTGGTGAKTYLWSNGRTTAANTGLVAGTYCVTVSDANLCTATACVTITQPSAVTASIASSTNVLCNGASTGSATAAGAGGTGAYSFVWSNGRTTAANTGLAAGTYCVTVSDANLCTATACVTITQPSAVTASIASSTNVLCNGGSTGSATAAGAGGTGAYSFVWSNGRTTAANTGLVAGTYCVTVTDANLCTATACVTITQPSAVTASIASSTNVLCNGASTGSATAAGAGGTGAYSFVWSNGRTTAANTGLAAGTYCVTVSDANLCTATACVTITQPSAVTASIASSTNVLCNGASTGSATAAGAGGTGAYSFVWSNGRTTAANTGLAAGTYCVTVSDANLCTATACVTITQPSATTITISNVTNTACSGTSGAIDISVAGGTGVYTYNWSNGRTTQDITGLSAATYTVTVTDANGCTTTNSANVSNTAAGTIGFATVNPLCNGGTGCITATVTGGSGNYGYLWSNGATVSNPCGLGAGTYTLTVTDTISAGTGGGQVNLYAQAFDGAHGWTLNTLTGANGAQPNVWEVNDSEGGVNPPGCGVGNNGNQTLHITCTSLFCGSLITGAAYNATQVSNTRAESPAFSTVGYTNLTLKFNFIANGEGLLDNASLLYNDGGGWVVLTPSLKSVICGSGQGQWTAFNVTLPVSCENNPNVRIGFNWTNNNSVGTDPSVAIDSVVVFSTATGVGAQICTIINDTTITAPTAVVASISASTNVLCNGASTGSATAAAVGGTGAHTFVWSNGQTTAMATGLAAGIHCVTATDANACTGTICVTITEPSAVTATITASSNALCNGGATGSATAAGAGGTGVYGFIWNNGQTTATATGLIAGTYCVTVSDANACTGTVCVTITQPSAVTATIASSSNANCNGAATGSATAAGAGGTGGYNFIWNNGQPTATATGLTAGVYTVTVSDANSCTATTSVTITQPSAVTASIASSTNANCGVADGTATAAGAGGTGGYTFIWNNGQPTATATGLAAGAYTVTVSDANLCTATTSVTITQPGSVTATITSSTSVTCNGLANGSATVSASGGSGSYTYIWNDGQPNATATGLAGGVYTVTVNDGGACIVTAVVTISEPAAISVTASVTSNYNGAHVSCFGAGDGEVTAVGNGGTPTYSFVWNNGQSTAVATGLSGGLHRITITDINGCTTTASTVITEPNTLAVSIDTVAPVVCVGSNNGFINISISGGTGTMTYNWSNGAATQDIAGLSDTTYTVIITDANGCTTTDTATVVTIGQIAVILDTIINNNCNGDSTGAIYISHDTSSNLMNCVYNTVVLNEILYRPVTANGVNPNTGEYIELVGPAGANIGCYVLTDGDWTITIPPGTIIPPDGIFSIGNDIIWGSGTFDLDAENCSCFTDGAGGSGLLILTDSPGEFVALFNGAGTFIQGVIYGTPTAGNTPSGNVISTIGTGGCPSFVTIPMPPSFETAPAGFASGTSIIRNPDGSGGWVPQIGGSLNACNLSSLSTVDTSITYIWSNGVTTQNNTGLAAGSYTVTATNGYGCTTIGTYTVTEPTLLVATINTTTDVECMGDAIGAINIDVVGGTNPYTFVWSNGATSEDATGLVAGNYCVTVTDALGCMTSICDSITEPYFSIPTDTFYICAGQSVQISVNTNASVITWTPSATLSNDTIFNPIANPITTTTYVVSASVSAGAACTMVDSIVVIVDSVAISLAGTNISCFGDSSGTITTTAAGTYTYLWNTGATTANLNNLPAGTYTVIATSAGSCVDSATYTVTEPTLLVTTINSVTNVDCMGDATGAINIDVVGGTNPYTFVWSNGMTSEDATGLTAGTYCVTITDAQGCMTSICDSISEPFFSIPTDTFSICPGDAVQIFVNTNATVIAWTPNTGLSNDSISNPIANPVVSTTYIVTAAVSASASCVMTDTVVVLVEAIDVNLGIVTNVNCYGDSTGSITTTIGAGTPNYLWSNGQTTATATGLIAGTYSLTVTNPGGSCQDTLTAIITEPTLPLALGTHISSDLTCNDANGPNDGEIEVVFSGGTPGYTYQWTANANNQTTATITGLAAGTYGLTVTDSLGCQETFTQVITEPGVINLTPSTTLVGCTGTNDGTATIAPSNGVAPYTFIWSVNANNQTTATATGLTASIYFVTVTDVNSCTMSASGIIVGAGTPLDSADAPLVVLTGSLDCDLNPIGALGINTTNNYTYSWSNGTTSQNATGLPAGTYGVTITNASGCTVDQTGTITSPFVPNVDPYINTVGTTVATVSNGTTVTIDGGNDETSLGASYVWTSSSTDVTIGNINNHTTTAVSSVGGTYTLTITATAGNCTDTGSVTLNVQSSFVGMPNAFAPEGNNSIFRPVGLTASDIIRFRVFNRWGQELYNGDELYNTGWDGRYMGVEQPSEIYLYLLEYNLGGGAQPEIIRGEFTLIR
jgi:gliding motility-associated-like protein